MSSNRLTRATLPAAGTILVLVLVLSGSSAVAAEQRCDELGSACVCSEPMNVNDGGIPSGHDFSDSSGATECDQHAKFFDTNKSSRDVRTVTETDMPAGNATSHVLEVTDGGGGIVWLNGRPRASSSDARVCVRYYFKVSRDFSGAGPNNAGCPSERNKLLQFSFGSGSPYQVSELPGPQCQGPPGSGLAPYGDISSMQHGMSSGGARSLQPPVDWTSCFEGEGWCRLESCVHGDLQAGRNIYVDTKLKALATGTEHVILNHGPVNPGQALSLAAADIFHGQGIGPRGSRFLSHFMQAAFSSNNGQWIGAAHEVEGGGDVSQVVPPPAPEPLQPPILLGISIAESAQDDDELLEIGVTMNGSSPALTATVTNGVGPYHFLYDCGIDGTWNGVDDTNSASSAYTCSAGTASVRVRMWDEGSSIVLEDTVQGLN